MMVDNRGDRCHARSLVGVQARPYELAMFPLGEVLVPGAILPLHVFEPRYRALMEHLTDGSDAPQARGEFGVVLIERGSEVGGDDVRSAIGTAARIAEARRFDDGRWAVVVVGVRRVEVTEWLPDDPWPRAMAVDLADEPSALGSAEATELIRSTTAQLRRVLATAAELGQSGAPATVEVADDLVAASYQVTALGPFGPLDRHRLLEASGPTQRLEEASRLLVEQRELLDLHLGADPDSPPSGS